ncbi:hypothetical protein SAMN02799630_04578 [Paenibacillus sp. UNCCL117]|uniref:hypothetical protein n=1 Tax=unclassified Paenibacillus TaxID=185978 RepID=UPI00088C72B3|nr:MULTISPECIES: hypothetical protein [unclassified Paenibacillus]SDD63711.1 hypothetical protein SAMN04488602_11162 [Paenibacillus sp. cl123]SFW58467.1 hypothetical protein SAMN02799630_04578 [Paenibacillus sp. UNCCL117]
MDYTYAACFTGTIKEMSYDPKKMPHVTFCPVHGTMIAAPEIIYKVADEKCHVTESVRRVFTSIEPTGMEELSRPEGTSLWSGVPELTEWRKQLWGIDVPEVKCGNDCWYEKKTPFGTVKTKYPCCHRRTTTHRAYMVVKYPKNVESAVKAEINRCGAAAAIEAEEIIRNAALAALPNIPASLAAGLAAIPLALERGIASFTTCMKNITVSDFIKRNIKIDIEKTKDTGSWKQV